MLNYILRRLMIMPIIIAGISVLIFGMLSLLTPYERAALYVSDIPKRQGAIDGILSMPFHLAITEFVRHLT